MEGNGFVMAALKLLLAAIVRPSDSTVPVAAQWV
jgi:hypothetical protein